MSALRRATARATRAGGGWPVLPEAKLQVLRRLVAQPGPTPAELAAQLHLARPTVSNLVRELVEDGLVERRPALLDGRSVRLHPTDRARQLLTSFRHGQVEVLHRALGGLPPVQRRRLLAALPALEELLALVEQPAPPPGAAPQPK